MREEKKERVYVYKDVKKQETKSHANSQTILSKRKHLEEQKNGNKRDSLTGDK